MRQINKQFLRLHKHGLLRPLAVLSCSIRAKILKSVGYNLDLIPGQLVRVDLLTDSLMYSILPQAGYFNKSRIEFSYLSLIDTFKKYFGYSYALPIAQGRMAEIVLARIMARNAMVVPSNMLFITTRLHQELNGAAILEIPVKEAYDLNSDFPFKGNLNTVELEKIISDYSPRWIPYIYLEVCVNASGGHPVSLENIREVSRIARGYKIPLILDATRILENAYLIKERENGYSQRPLSEIVREFCSYSDGCTMSATKDFFVESGGFIATNNQEIYLQAQDIILAFGDGLPVKAKARLNDVLLQGFSREKWVYQRLKKVEYLWSKLKRSGLPVVNPCGGHAVFLDTKELYKILPAEYHPDKAFLAHLYLSSGVRAGENVLTAEQRNQAVKMIRLAVPTRRYSLAQMDYVAKKLMDAWKEKEKIKGLKKIYQPSSLSGSFFAEYKLMD